MILYKNKKLVIPTGINPHYLEDSSVLNNQDKEITITSNGKTTLVHDPGFSGLGTVKINTYVGEQLIQPFYSTTITENGDYDIFPDEGYDAIAEIEVTVDVQPELQDKTVDSSTNEQVITHDSSVYGLSSVTVNPYVLDEKTVDSSTREQVITSDVDGLKSVTVIPYVLTSLDVDSSTAMQRFRGQFGDVIIDKYELDEKTVDSSTASQIVTSDKDGLSKVTVNPYVLDSKTVDSSTVSQTVISDEDGLSSVTVNPYVLDSKTVDSSTVEQTILSDVDGLQSVTINPYVLEQKAREPIYDIVSQDASAGNVDITTGAGYDGMSKVRVGKTAIINRKTFDSSTVSQTFNTINQSTYAKGVNEIVVNPYVLDSSSAVFTENGEYVFTSSQDGLSRVDVSVNIDTQAYYNSGYSAGETAGIAEGIAEQKAKLTSETFVRNGTYTREDGWNEVVVDIEGIALQSKTVDSSTNSQTVTPDSSYYGLSSVTVNPYAMVNNRVVGEQHSIVQTDIQDPNDYIVTPGTGYDGIKQININKTSILDGVTINPSASANQYWTANTYNFIKGVALVNVPKVTAAIDANIVAENIKKNVTILGVTGDYEGGGTVIPGRPYISNKGIGRSIYLGVAGYDATGQDVNIRCIFSIPTGGTYSPVDVSRPLSTTKCIVGFGGDGALGTVTEQAVGVGYGRGSAGEGANRIITLYGAQTYDYITTIITPGNNYIYEVSCVANDEEDDEAHLDYCTRSYRHNFGTLVSGSTTWKDSGALSYHGSWAAFQWDTDDDTYGSALVGTRIYEIHLRIGSNMYDFYPVSTNGQVGFAKYTNGVFTANILASTDYFEYGVFY